MTAGANTPNVLVVYDRSVHRNGTNPLLLYRLFQNYPPAQLQVLHSDTSVDDPAIRLTGVKYHYIPLKLKRYVNNRFNKPLWPLSFASSAAAFSHEALTLLGDFRPDVIVSVANGYLWFAADALSRHLGVPLHLFLHEDWSYLVSRTYAWPWKPFTRWLSSQIARPVLRRAAKCYAVSPGMVEETKLRYGVASDVIYPNRGEDSPNPELRVRIDDCGPPIVAHCGWVHLAGNAILLQQVGRMLYSSGGHLDLYTLHEDRELNIMGLGPPVSRRIGFLPAAEMGRRLGQTANVLLVTGSFDPDDRVHESTLFPSKIADYTAVGLPIVVWAPSYSSIARWAASNPQAALLITDPDPNPVVDACRKLALDPDASTALAEGAIRVGLEMFTAEIARKRLFQGFPHAR